MTLQGMPVQTDGHYFIFPADSIAGNGGYTDFWIIQNDITGAAVGSCVYSVTDQGGSSSQITFSYGCPWDADPNTADAVWNGTALSDITIQMIPNPLPQYGHPVWVQFTIIQNTQ